MLDDLIDGIESAHVVALNLIWRQQLFSTEPRQHMLSLLHRRAKFFKQLCGRNSAALAELLGPIALVFLAIKGRNQPLVDITVQMQNEIADAVARLVGPPPHLLLAQRRDGLAQPRPVLAQQLVE